MNTVVMATGTYLPSRQIDSAELSGDSMGWRYKLKKISRKISISIMLKIYFL